MYHGIALFFSCPMLSTSSFELSRHGALTYAELSSVALCLVTRLPVLYLRCLASPSLAGAPDPASNVASRSLRGGAEDRREGVCPSSPRSVAGHEG